MSATYGETLSFTMRVADGVNTRTFNYWININIICSTKKVKEIIEFNIFNLIIDNYITKILE